MINDHPPEVLFQIYDSLETKKGHKNWGQQRELKLHLKYTLTGNIYKLEH